MAKAKSQKIKTGRTQHEQEEVPINIIECSHPRKAGKHLKITTTSHITPEYMQSIANHIRMLEETSEAAPLPKSR